jgi:predicted metalloprotease with PDZ domain
MQPLNRRDVFRYLLCYCLFLFVLTSTAQTNKAPIKFVVSFPRAAEHFLQVEMQFDPKGKSISEFKLPNWTTGYYQLMNYSKEMKDFTVNSFTDPNISWKNISPNHWQINSNGKPFIIRYNIFSNKRFVAANYVDEEFAYLSPAGIFLYPANELERSSVIEIKPYSNWNRVATGLDPVKDKAFTYTAPDFDILYDSPFILGSKLEDLNSFYVKLIPHHFTGYKMGDFDKKTFIEDLTKIVRAAADIIGEIPYKHYSFLAIGPGGGGIEHLNSTSIAFTGQGLDNNRAAKIRMYNFLAHEYFHHYNVKRIRPIELGPFDYDKGSRTNMLWVSEGLTVYYEFLVLRRAGISTREEMLQSIKQNIISHESKPGKLFQTLAQASWATWSDGPFGRTEDEVNKTISYYDKGPVVGAMLDFRIRHETNNEKSLDDVMRRLYYEYYKGKKRGFTEAEFKKVCEEVAGKRLDDFFEYIYTVKELDYATYFGYAGLQVDQKPMMVPAYLGANVTDRRDSVVINSVDWQSPAWNAGVRRQMHILELNGQPVKKTAEFKKALSAMKTGDNVVLTILKTDKTTEKINISLSTQTTYSYNITVKDNPTPLEQKIRNSWLGNE